MLAVKFNTVASPASFNNQIGVPLTLLKISNNTQYAVVEMGMNHKGELLELTTLVQPDVAAVTNIAESHMEFFKDKREIAAAKAELFSGLNPKGYAVINRDTFYFSYLKNRCRNRVISCGLSKFSTYRIKDVSASKKGYEFKFGKKGKMRRYSISIHGEHNLLNAALAMAICFEEGLSEKVIRRGLLRLKLPEMRMQIQRFKQGVIIVNDAYNANPFSVQKSMDAFSQLRNKGKKIMVFGDMLELGKKSPFFHLFPLSLR